MFTWSEAQTRWVKEKSYKRSLKSDLSHFKWILVHCNQHSIDLNSISPAFISKLVDKKRAGGASEATINRMLALIKSVLRLAKNEWQWVDRTPHIKLKKEANRGLRWLTKEEFNIFLEAIPEHWKPICTFAVMTGLRKANIKNLKWNQVDFERKLLIIPANQFKSDKIHSIPLNETALSILESQNRNTEFVFLNANHQPLGAFPKLKTWRNSIKRANLPYFKFHDLRHTWASWHIQSGTTLQELYELGGWSSYELVLRYAHLSRDHLKKASENIV